MVEVSSLPLAVQILSQLLCPPQRKPDHVSPQLTSKQRSSIAPRMKSKFLILAYKSLQDLVLDKYLSDLVNFPTPITPSQHRQ